MLSDYTYLKINNKNLTVSKGAKLLDVIQKEGFNLPNYCSGQGVCGKCRVRLAGMFSDLTPEEKKLLSQEEQDNGTRLACQVVVEGEGSVWLDDEKNPSIVSDGKQIADVGKYCSIYTLHALDNKSSGMGISLVEKYLTHDEEYLIEAGVLKKLAVLKNVSGHVFIIREGEVIDCIKKKAQNQVYGAAFDIGTTTVVAYLVNLLTGDIVNVASMLNPQRVYGDDVLSRISYCDKPGGLEILHTVIGRAMNGLISQLCRKRSINEEEIYECTIVGNPTMCQIYLNIHPYSIGRSPYHPAYRSCVNLAACESGLSINPGGRVMFYPVGC